MDPLPQENTRRSLRKEACLKAVSPALCRHFHAIAEWLRRDRDTLCTLRQSRRNHCGSMHSDTHRTMRQSLRSHCGLGLAALAALLSPTKSESSRSESGNGIATDTLPCAVKSSSSALQAPDFRALTQRARCSAFYSSHDAVQRDEEMPVQE